MSEDDETFKIAGHMVVECSSGNKKVLRTIAEPVTLEKEKKFTFLSLRGRDLLDERRQDPLIQRDGTLRLWCHLDIFRNYNVLAGPVEQPNPEDQVCKWNGRNSTKKPCLHQRLFVALRKPPKTPLDCFYNYHGHFLSKRLLFRSRL